MIRHAIIIITLLLSALGASAQKAIHIYHDGKKEADVMLNYQIDSIYFTTVGKEFHQVFATSTEKKSYPAASIDSIKFQGEFMKILGPKNITVPYYGDAVVYGKILCNDDRYVYSGNIAVEEFGNGVYEYKNHVNLTFKEKDEYDIIISSNNPATNYSTPLYDTIHVTHLDERVGSFIDEPGSLGHSYYAATCPEGRINGEWMEGNIRSFILFSQDGQSRDIKVNPLIEGTLELAPERKSGHMTLFDPIEGEEWVKITKKVRIPLP